MAEQAYTAFQNGVQLTGLTKDGTWKENFDISAFVPAEASGLILEIRGLLALGGLRHADSTDTVNTLLAAGTITGVWAIGFSSIKRTGGTLLVDYNISSGDDIYILGWFHTDACVFETTLLDKTPGAIDITWTATFDLTSDMDVADRGTGVIAIFVIRNGPNNNDGGVRNVGSTTELRSIPSANCPMIFAIELDAGDELNYYSGGAKGVVGPKFLYAGYIKFDAVAASNHGFVAITDPTVITGSLVAPFGAWTDFGINPFTSATTVAAMIFKDNDGGGTADLYRQDGSTDNPAGGSRLNACSYFPGCAEADQLIERFNTSPVDTTWLTGYQETIPTPAPPVTPPSTYTLEHTIAHN